MANNNTERCILTFEGTNTNGMQGGLVKAHEISQIECEIRLDGKSPRDESCQFYLYKRFDVTHTSTPQNVYRFESVKYSRNNLYWNEDTKVYLSYDDTKTEHDLANLRNVWWEIVDCSNYPNCRAGSKLLAPFNFPGPVDTPPYYLVFEEPKVTIIPSLKIAIKNGLMSLTEMR